MSRPVHTHALKTGLQQTGGVTQQDSARQYVQISRHVQACADPHAM